MSDPYIGEIRMFGGNFAPAGWAFCDGQIMPISENDALFNLIGTTYGGDGQSTFGLPDLRGRVPIHMGQGSGLTNRSLAESGGVETVTLTTSQIAAHTHPLLGSTDIANLPGPATSNPANNAVLATTSTFDHYVDSAANVQLAGQSILGQGGSQPHENMQPYLCVNFILSLFGVFPQQN
ncbi:MAG TPA: tail fiber protein [Acidimicrobiales bacterium]|nr:tail fiber protein [Acidimicrobiales bacterium]